MEIRYLPVGERTPDTQYRELLQRILDEGREVLPQQEHPAWNITGHQMRFRFRNGFPIITERDLVSAGKHSLPMYQLAIGELIAFLNGARTVSDIASYGAGHWWSEWATPEKCAKRGLEPGDLGPGSYGPAFHDFPTSDGAPFNQVAHLVEQIRELPHLRTHFLSPWIPQYIGRGKGKQQRVVVAPCHGWVHVCIFPTEGELVVHHFQRSADCPVGLVFNIIQYSAFALMLGHVTGFRPVEVVYTISDAHIYTDQIPAVERMLATEPRRFPTVTLVDPPDSLFDFRPHHFAVSDYTPSLGRMKIWTPI